MLCVARSGVPVKLTLWESPATRTGVGCRHHLGASKRDAWDAGATNGGPTKLCGETGVGTAWDKLPTCAWYTPEDPQDAAGIAVAPRAQACSLGDGGLSGEILPEPEKPCTSGAWGVTGHGLNS